MSTSPRSRPSSRARVSASTDQRAAQRARLNARDSTRDGATNPQRSAQREIREDTQWLCAHRPMPTPTITTFTFNFAFGSLIALLLFGLHRTPQAWARRIWLRFADRRERCGRRHWVDHLGPSRRCHSDGVDHAHRPCRRDIDVSRLCSHDRGLGCHGDVLRVRHSCSDVGTTSTTVRQRAVPEALQGRIGSV